MKAATAALTVLVSMFGVFAFGIAGIVASFNFVLWFLCVAAMMVCMWAGVRAMGKLELHAAGLI